MIFLENHGEFVEALNVLTQLLQLGCKDVDLYLAGARNYFKMQDYDRAARWISLTLDFDPQNVPARLLLADVLLARNRMEEALSVYDFVAKNLLRNMTVEERAAMEESLYKCVQHNKYLVAYYPNNVDFLVNEDRLHKLINILDENKFDGA